MAKFTESELPLIKCTNVQLLRSADEILLTYLRVNLLVIIDAIIYNTLRNIYTTHRNGGLIMPTIMPISDLRNYTDVLKEVDARNRVYLTRNGHGAYTIMTVEEADELDRLRAVHNVLADLERAEIRSEREGWVDDDEIQKIMGIEE